MTQTGERHHPWRDLRELADIEVVYETLPAGLWGYYDEATRTIHLDEHLTQCERRCTLAHELIHVERGDAGHLTGWYEEKQERAVDVEASRRLIEIVALVDALAWAGNVWELADVLWVDVATARVRMETLTPAERMYLAEMSARADWGAA